MPDGPSSHANEVCVPGLYHLKGAVVIFSWHMLVVWAILCEFVQISPENKLLSEHTQDLKSLCNNLSLNCHIHAIPKAYM